MAKQKLIAICETHRINFQYVDNGLGWQCPRCLAERYADTRPVVHDGDEEATDQVLKDMAAQDALDDFDAD